MVMEKVQSNINLKPQVTEHVANIDRKTEFFNSQIRLDKTNKRNQFSYKKMAKFLLYKTS